VAYFRNSALSNRFPPTGKRKLDPPIRSSVFIQKKRTFFLGGWGRGKGKGESVGGVRNGGTLTLVSVPSLDLLVLAPTLVFLGYAPLEDQ